MSFETRVHGKWILAGEHAVLRGSPALVFPLYSRSLDLTYLPQASFSSTHHHAASNVVSIEKTLAEDSEDLRLDFSGEFGEELQLCFWGVLEKACELKNVHRRDLAGRVKLHSSIPVGAGLGASAALCVAVARWFQSMQLLQENELQDFSRNLENLFHGESSGVDVAVTLSKKPLRFMRSLEGPNVPVESQFFNPAWTPRWYLSYSGKRGVTRECVSQVKGLFSEDFKRAQTIDEDMALSVKQAEQALLSSAPDRLDSLVGAIDLAAACFRAWNLIDSASEEHMKWLRDQGARAVKPTGSGNGGFMLSLWEDAPDLETQKKLIPCF